jgi:hypothetical protein
MEFIVKFACDELGGATISCLIVGGEPYFKGIEVARVWGYENPANAVFKHVPLKFKNKCGFLLSRLGYLFRVSGAQETKKPNGSLRLVCISSFSSPN